MLAPQRRKRDTFLPWMQLLVDLATISAVLRVCFWVRFSTPFFENVVHPSLYPFYLKSFHLVTLLLIFFMRMYGLYQAARALPFLVEMGKVFKAVTAATIVFLAITFFLRDFSYSRTFWILSGFVLALAVSCSRYLLGLGVMVIDKKRESQRNILILGVNEHSRKLIAFYKKNPRFSTQITGFLDNRVTTGELIDNVPVLGKISELVRFIQERREIHEVVLALPGMPQDKVLNIIYECEKEMVVFRWIADIFGLIASKMNVNYLGSTALLSFADAPLSDWENRFLKRGVDILLSASALIFLSPLFLVIAVLIRRDSGKPIFYKQERIGENGRSFKLLKFRTMRTGAEEKTGPVWAKQNDDRRTRLGVALRENNLDELPQLWNVLKGDMSLVGPRPERPFFVGQFKENIPRYMARHSIRSGITGWAQVHGLRGNTSIEARTQYDLYYIENWSLLLDLKILLMTLLTKKNAY